MTIKHAEALSKQVFWKTSKNNYFKNANREAINANCDKYTKSIIFEWDTFKNARTSPLSETLKSNT